jgi:hypothetical protein
LSVRSTAVAGIGRCFSQGDTDAEEILLNLISYPLKGVDDVQAQNEFYWKSKIAVNAIESIGNIAKSGNSKVVRSLIIQLAHDDWEVRFVLEVLMAAIADI